jgi:TPR repeat protein
MFKKIILISCTLLLVACGNTTQQLHQGKESFAQKNYTAAFKDLKPAAEKGNKDAQYAVGYMYFYGKGTDKDKKSARKWIRKAADQGQPQAVKALDSMKKKPVQTAAPTE